tara:strand:+ start:414 stop:545 length:132 start_codon:yes stop_codon:yes gene_type:complete
MTTVEIEKMYKESNLNQFMTLNDLENYLGFMSIENIKKHFNTK